MKSPFPRPNGRALAAAIAVLALAASASAQAKAASPGAAVSLDEAIASALASDPGIASADLDALTAAAKAAQATRKTYPSLTASASGTYLGEQKATTMSLGPISATLPAGLDHSIALGLNLQYPVFAGFRIKESIAIAGLQAQAKEIAKEQIRRSLVFDVTRAYWEAVRASYNVDTLSKNLELMKQNADLAAGQLGQGVATRADQLAAQMRLEQATEDLGDARSLQRRAFLTLASLMGKDLAAMGIATASMDAALPFELSTKPEDAGPAASQPAAKPEAKPAAKLGDEPMDEAALVSAALASRPETRTAELASKLALHAVELSRAALYPTVALTGSASLADPNQRALVQKEEFAFSGSIGIAVSYDVGGIPAALDDIKAQGLAAEKAKSDAARQRNAIVMDVENCIVAFERARRDLASTEAMVAQAEENLRVVAGRVAAGTAKDIDLSSAKFDLIRMRFAVTNKRIDVIVARADLARATAAEPIQ